MTLQDSACAMIEAYFDKGDFQRDLAALVARPTESQDPRGKPHLHAYLRDDMAPMLDAMGFARRFHDNPEPDGPPILTAERIEDPALPTVLSYGHGDVVRAQRAAGGGCVHRLGRVAPAARAADDHPLVRFAAAAIERAVGVAPDILPNLGGSLPNDCFAKVMRLPKD